MHEGNSSLSSTKSNLLADDTKSYSSDDKPSSQIETVETSAKLTVRDFNKKIIWKLCPDLLDPPLPVVEALRYPPSCSEYMKEELRRKHEENSDWRRAQQSAREPELLRKLEEVRQRVVQSRYEAVVDNVEVWSVTAVKSELRSNRLEDFECDLCKNKDRRFFVTDGPSGDTICTGVGGLGCGNVVQDHRVDESSQFRVFADDEGKDRNHHGPVPDQFMPDSENMKTSVVGMGSLCKKLMQTHQDVERNLSTINTDDRRTKTDYRTKQKRQAFSLMEHIAANLNIHDTVIEKAKIEFARFRDTREHMINFNGVVAACMSLAFEELVLSNQHNSKGDNISGSSSTDWINIPEKNAEAERIALESLTSAPAISTLKEIPLKQWTAEQLKTWLLVVLTSEPRETIDCVIETIFVYIENALRVHSNCAVSASAGSSDILQPNFLNKFNPETILGKKRYPAEIPSCFGSTTINNRAKRSKTAGNSLIVNLTNSSHYNLTDEHINKLSYKNQHISSVFCTMDLNIVLGKYSNSIVKKLRSSIQMRLQYETINASRNTGKEFEDNRLCQEKSFEVPLPLKAREVEQEIECASAVVEEDEILRSMLSNSVASRHGKASDSFLEIKGTSKPKFVVKVGGDDDDDFEESEYAGVLSLQPKQKDDSDIVGNYIFENGKRYTLVSQIRTDPRTGAHVQVCIKKEIAMDDVDPED